MPRVRRHLAVLEAVHRGRGFEEALGHRADLEVLRQLLRVEAVLLVAEAILEEVAVAGGKRVGGLAAEANVLLHELRVLGLRWLAHGFAHAREEVAHGLRRLRHARLGLVVRPRRIAEQVRLVVTRFEDAPEELHVRVATAVREEDVEILGSLAIPGVRRKREEVRVVGRDLHLSGRVGLVLRDVVGRKASELRRVDGERGLRRRDVLLELLRELRERLVQRLELRLSVGRKIQAVAPEVTERVVQQAGALPFELVAGGRVRLEHAREIGDEVHRRRQRVDLRVALERGVADRLVRVGDAHEVRERLRDRESPRRRRRSVPGSLRTSAHSQAHPSSP